MKGGIKLSKEHISISNEAFIELLKDLITFDKDKFKEDTLKELSDELSKPKRMQDFTLIHECYITLSECFGYEYNNEYEKIAEKQQRRQKILREIKTKSFGKVAMF